MSVVEVSQAKGRVPVTIFKLNDRINMGNVSEIESAAREGYDQGMRYILIDLTNAPSITSAGLRTLLVIYRLLGASENAKPSAQPVQAASDKLRRSARVKLLNPSPEVSRTLEIAGFDRYFESYTDFNQAVASF